MVVAAAGRSGDAEGAHFHLSELQAWKRERLLDNDAYAVKTYESTLRARRSPCRPRRTAP